MAAILAWARLDLRRRWRSLVVLALLTAVAGTITITAFAGARRADSALDRLMSVTDPATVAVVQNDVEIDWSPVTELPYVEATGHFLTGGLGELGDGISVETLVDTPTDGDLLTALERPVLLDGRLYRTDAPDEAVVTQRFVERWGKGVGDSVELRLPAPKQIGMGDGEAGALRGPRIDLRIVGVIRSPYYADWPGEVGTILPSPGVATAYPQNYYGTGGREQPSAPEEILVRLAGGSDDVDRLRADLARLLDRPDVNVLDLTEQYADREHSIAFEATSLNALGVAAVVASIVVVGQAILRQVAGASEQLRIAAALGMTRGQLASAQATGPVLAGALGAALAVGGAVIASGLFPIGTAAALEPDPGLRPDTFVVVCGGLVMIALVAISSAIGGWFAARPPRVARVRRSSVTTALTGSRLPVPALVGCRLALESGRGASAVPVRSALVASVAGVAGLIAVALVGSGVSDAVEHPERYGQTLQSGFFTGFGGFEFIPTAEVEQVLATDDRVTAIATPRVSVATDPGGTTSVTLFSLEETALPMEPVVLDGRLPESDDEVLLAPASLADLDAEVGDTITLSGTAGVEPLTVVGSGLMPEGPQNRFDEGGWLTSTGFDVLFAEFDFRVIGLSLTPEAAADPGIHDDLSRLVATRLPKHADTGFELGPWSNGLVTEQLEQVQPLAYVLAGFLALLACGGVGHALIVAARRRAAELATFRAIGMTPQQVRTTVYVQALVAALVGIVVGVPIGFALGRTVWRSVAAYTPLEHVPPTAWWAVLGIIPAAAAVFLLLAWWPARTAGRSRVADILRTE